MKYRKLIILIIVWIVILLINYYLTPFFILPFVWLISTLILLIFTINQLVKFIKERKTLTKQRIISLLITSTLFFLTFYKFYGIPNRLIERIDWITLKYKRIEIVQKVKKGVLKPNVKWNKWVCELNFEFPIISNGGNDIGIFKNKKTNSLTIQFWVFRNFFDSPSTYIIYTEDEEQKKIYDKKITENPENNWKLEENWYRILGD